MSDLRAANQADLVFARSRLANLCRQKQLPFFPLEDFSTVGATITRHLIQGNGSGTPGAIESTHPGRPPRDPAIPESEVPTVLKKPFQPPSRWETQLVAGGARRILAVAALCGFLTQVLPPGLAQSSGSNPSWIPPRVDREFPSLFELYRHLHSNPEIAFQEVQTARRMARELESSGFEVSRNIGGHGVVGLLRNGEGPTLMLRTDLDGLPITEETTGLEYASQVRIRDPDGQSIGLMHACGHDVHMTLLRGGLPGF